MLKVLSVDVMNLHCPCGDRIRRGDGWHRGLSGVEKSVLRAGESSSEANVGLYSQSRWISREMLVSRADHKYVAIVALPS